jgi:hypothetical protein
MNYEYLNLAKKQIEYFFKVNIPLNIERALATLFSELDSVDDPDLIPYINFNSKWNYTDKNGEQQAVYIIELSFRTKVDIIEFPQEYANLKISFTLNGELLNYGIIPIDLMEIIQKQTLFATGSIAFKVERDEAWKEFWEFVKKQRESMINRNKNK